MATISKQGGHNPPLGNHIGEDKSFGRASQMLAAARKSGLNPHNADAGDDPVVNADAVPITKPVQANGHTRH